MVDASNGRDVRPCLLVGLGNPGKQYEQTRHNVGFELIQAFALRWQTALSDHRKFQGKFGEAGVPHLSKVGGKVRLLQPQTYMNRSGQSIRAVVDWFKLEPQAVLVIYDDMDLPLGRLRLRLGGSAGGHNGMKSAIAHLGTQNFPRLRIGIGIPRTGERKQETVGHVLGKFAPDELPLVRSTLMLGVEAIEYGLRHGLEKAMSLYNNREPG
jgi:PTH1 family peptidyl-tRNA hydrolase